MGGLVPTHRFPKLWVVFFSFSVVFPSHPYITLSVQSVGCALMCVRSPRIIPHFFSCAELVILMAAEFWLPHPVIIKKKKESLEERTLLAFLSIGMS